MSKNKKSSKTSEFKMTKEGALGLLAFGDIGLREWRKFKNNKLTSETKNEEEK